MGTKETLKKTFSKNLDYYMKLANKSQADIVHDLKYGSGIVSEWVSGKKYPRIDKIQALADYLGIYKYQLIEPLSLQFQATTSIKIPLYTNFLLKEEQANYIAYNTEKKKHTFFALSITDNKYYPEFRKNDIVIIEQTSNFIDKQLVFVEKNKKTYICTIKIKEKEISFETLQGTSTSNETKVFSIHEVSVLGVIKELKRNY